MFKTLAKLFALKPYGDHLVDGTTDTWLLLAALNILSIAFCDALAWGYFAYTTARGTVAWVAAAIAALIVFVLVGSLDAMFVMHDRSERHRLAIAARVILVVLTFTVTAPFLTQLFFARDIEANIRRANDQTIAARRNAVADSFERRRSEMRARLTARQRDLENEIAGSGTSARYGEGPTSAAIRWDILTLQSDIAAADHAKAKELQAFDQAVATPGVLASRYGVHVVTEGPDARARAIADLEKSPSFRSTRLAIKAFLLFMFLGLVCLKLFQPQSVRIYYSAPLQAAHARARAGMFDHRLDERERVSTGGMTPVRFADWFENDQQLRDATERLQQQTALSIERLKAHEDAARALHHSLRVEITTMQEDLADAAKANEELEHQVAIAEHELTTLRARIDEQQQALEGFRHETSDDLSLADQQMLIGSRNRTARTLAENRGAAASLATTLARLARGLEASRTRENGLRESLAAANAEMAALAKALQDSRQRRVAEIFATA